MRNANDILKYFVTCTVEIRLNISCERFAWKVNPYFQKQKKKKKKIIIIIIIKHVLEYRLLLLRLTISLNIFICRNFTLLFSII